MKEIINRILLSWIPSALSIVSTVCDLTLILRVCRQIRDLRIDAISEKKDTSRNIIIAKMIIVLAVSDVVYNMIRTLNQMPSILYSTYVTNTQCFSGNVCQALAFLDQFSTVFDTLAQLVLAFAFLQLLLQTPVPKNSHSCTCLYCSLFQNSCCILSFIFCLLLSIGIACIPLYIHIDNWNYSQFFNYTDTFENTYSCQCWILGGFEYFWIILVIAAWVLHCIVLIVSCCKFGWYNWAYNCNCTCRRRYKRFRESSGSTSLNTKILKYQKLQKLQKLQQFSGLLRQSLQPWVICYTITRLPIIFVRFWQLQIDFDNNNNNNNSNSDVVNFSFMVIHNIFASIIGIGNLITYLCVRKIEKKIYQENLNLRNEYNGCQDTPDASLRTQSQTHSEMTQIGRGSGSRSDNQQITLTPSLSGSISHTSHDDDRDDDSEIDPNKSIVWFEEVNSSAAPNESIQRSMKTDPQQTK